MTKRLIIVGAGGFGRGVFGWVSGSPDFLNKFEISEIAFIDDSEPKTQINAPVIGTIKDYIPASSDRFICAIGSPAARNKIVEKLRKRGAVFQSFVDDRAVLGPNVFIGEGAIVCPGVVISAGAEVRDQVHINFNCSIGHETEIGPFSTLSPAVNLMGELKVGNSVFFGGSATVLPRLRIGSNSTIGAGAVITKNIPESVVVKGVPGRWERKPTIGIKSPSYLQSREERTENIE